LNADRLPTLRKDPPPKRRTEAPLAIRFAQQVQADKLAGWVRLNQKVTRSVVTAKAREYAKINGVTFRVALDYEIPGDTTSARYSHLFCRLTPVEDIQDIPIEGK